VSDGGPIGDSRSMPSPARAAPTNATSLTRRLDNLAADLDLPPRRLRRLVAVTVVGQLLGTTEAGIVKGETSLEVRLGTARTRVSSDLDTVRRESLTAYRDALDRELRTGWQGFSGRMKDLGPIPTPAPAPYRPHRYRLKIDYRGGDVTSLDLEVSAEEVGGLEAVEWVAPRDVSHWFSIIGLPIPRPIPVLRLEHQVAQKLHACTLPDTSTWVNDRVHDLVDLQLAMAGSAAVDLVEIQVTTRRLFTARRTHAWPPTVMPRAGWGVGYARQAAGLEVLQELDDAVAWANRLIADIADS